MCFFVSLTLINHFSLGVVVFVVCVAATLSKSLSSSSPLPYTSGVFLKFVTDAHGLYNSDARAMKVAGTELLGLRAYARADVTGLHLPLATLIDYRGCVMLCCVLCMLYMLCAVLRSCNPCLGEVFVFLYDCVQISCHGILCAAAWFRHTPLWVCRRCVVLCLMCVQHLCSLFIVSVPPPSHSVLL